MPVLIHDEERCQQDGVDQVINNCQSHKKMEGYFNGYIHASRYPGSQVRTG